MHHKFFVVDGRRVFTGSANISDSDIGGYSANVMLVIDSAAVAGAYLAEFEQLWAGRFHSEKKRSANTSFNVDGIPVRVLFSPQDKAVDTGVRPLLAQARSTIDLAIFYLTNKYITADLLAAQQRGVQVRVIVDATSAENGYSKHEILRAAGIQVKVEAWGGKMHAKAAAIDRKWLIAGSMNWTRAGDDTNDENTLLINSPRLAAQQHAYFDALWRGIPERWLTDRPAPESRESGTACSDGIDNDFDGLIDTVAGNADPGCSGRAVLAPLPGHRVISKAESPAPPAGYTLVRAVQK
jgi:phosphatidylserine/phosphatidylglycerophosphate/cardiolipin synthase-like enzyme